MCVLIVLVHTFMVTGFSSLWSHFIGLIWELIPSLWTVMMYVRLFCFIQLSFKNRQSQWFYFYVLVILIFLCCENIKKNATFFLSYLIFISYLPINLTCISRANCSHRADGTDSSYCHLSTRKSTKIPNSIFWIPYAHSSEVPHRC